MTVFTLLIQKIFLIGFGFGALASSAHSTELEYTLDPVIVKAKSSFDSLSEDEYLPQKKLSYDKAHGETINRLEKNLVVPSRYFGYPGGAMGSALGGRSIDETQVSTLGVPLNLPQGGGPDLSFFPAFLWSDMTVSMVPSIAGFSTQGVSGSMQLELWTRAQVRELKRSTNISRITGGVNRQLQNFSVGTKNDNIAMLAGMNFGRQSGPAGSLSYYFIRKPRSHFIFHMLGTDQEGDNPGDKVSPTPFDKKKTWRVITALESHQELGDDEQPVTLESTFYADLQQAKYVSASTESNRTQVFGLENALQWGKNTIALTARLVNFQNSTFGSFTEWPILGQYYRDFQLSDAWKMRLAGGGNFVTEVGVSPIARASFKYNIDPDKNWFFEANSLPKMPTLTARHYLYGTYHGNPDLKVERVNGLIGGYESLGNKVESVTTLKAEYRNQIQIDRGTTTINAGNATMFSLNEDFKWKITERFHNQFGVNLTYSKLATNSLPYPDLPYFSALWNASYVFSDQFKLQRSFRYMGRSTTSTGGEHSDYFLMDLSLDYSPMENTTLTLGCDNVTDKRAEVVVNYPLIGRIFYLNLVSQF